jgi:hypothetical protein
MANLQDVLSKKLISGLSTQNPGEKFTLETLSSRSAIFKTQIYGQDIPSTAPIDLTNATLTSASDNTNKTTPTTGLGSKKKSNSYPYIEKYSNLPLYDPIGSGKSFVYSKVQTNNYLSQTIPYAFDPVGGYQYTVYGKNGSDMDPSDASYPWVLDTDAGVLVFTGGAFPKSDPRYPPNITFWRYNGTLGVGESGATILNLNNNFTGVNTVPTAALGTNNQQIASTAFVRENASSSITPLNNNFTGVNTVPTAALGTNNQQIASTAFVRQNASSLTLNNNFTGVNTVPTAAVGTNNQQIASTAFVLANASSITSKINNALAIGNRAGENNQESNAVAIGYYAGNFNQQGYAVAIGSNAGQNSQQGYAVAIGSGAGQNSQQGGAISLGFNAGQNSQRNWAVAIGESAGQNNQKDSAVAIGKNAGQKSQQGSAVAIGSGAGQNTQQPNAVAVGLEAGQNDQQQSAIAIGNTAGQISQQQGAVSVGWSAGQNSQGENAIAIGNDAGQYTQQQSAIAIGNTAGQFSQQQGAVSVGWSAGQNNQQQGAVSVGSGAGQYTQQINAIAIGLQAGQNNQQLNAVAIGNGAGNISQQLNAVAIGTSAGNVSQQRHAVAIGTNAGKNSQGSFAVALGNNAGQTNQSYCAIAIGGTSGNYGQSTFGISIGTFAGQTNQGTSAIAIGTNAGQNSQGENAIAIGNNAGITHQTANSIVINASSSQINANAQGFFVNPIRNASNATVLSYNTSTKEITYSDSATTSNTFSSVTIEDVNTKPASATSGSLTIKHKTPGGSSSIVFPSALNTGSDYGYIQYDDNKDSGQENSKLTIGTKDDGGAFGDDLHLNPSGTLYIHCHVTNYTSSNGGIFWSHWGGGWYMQDDTYMRSAGSKIVYTNTVFQQGQLGGGLMVSTTQDPKWKEYVSNLTLAQDNSYIQMIKYNANKTTVQGAIGVSYFNSDQRLKENIKEPIIKNVCQYIEKIEFKSFQWKRRDYSENDGICELGVIAQQLEFVHPDLVNTMSDVDTFGDGVGTKGVNTNAFSTFMMKGIQELIAENKNLKEEVASLKSDMQKIKDELKVLTNAFSRYLLVMEPGIPTNK